MQQSLTLEKPLGSQPQLLAFSPELSRQLSLALAEQAGLKAHTTTFQPAQ